MADIHAKDDTSEPFDYAAWIEASAPHACPDHTGGTRVGWSGVRGFYGIAYRCGCSWGSDDGRGEGWSRGIDSDLRGTDDAR